MLYKLLNYYTEKKIFSKRLLVRKCLVRDLHEQEAVIQKQMDGDKATNLVYGDESDGIKANIQIIKERISVDDSYTKAANYFQHDAKRKYIVNQNYLKYLNAIDYLYKTSAVSVGAGIYTAPEQVYKIINDVRGFFNELENTLAIK